MLLDQLMASLSPDLHVYVKEHGVYTKAYPGPDKGKRIMATKPLTCGQPALKRDFSKIVSWMWGNETYQTLLL